MCSIIFVYMTLTGQLALAPPDTIAKEFPKEATDNALAYCAKTHNTCPLMVAKRGDGEFFVRCANGGAGVAGE